MSGRNPSGRSRVSATSAALSGSIHTPLLWSVTTTAWIPDPMNARSQAEGVVSRRFSRSGDRFPKSVEAGVCVWMSTFHHEAPETS